MSEPVNMIDNELIRWLEERRANCARIAATKYTAADIAGWIEDANYFRLAIERIAELEKELAEPWKHSEHWRNSETGQVECECCCKWALDAAEDHKTIAALEAMRTHCENCGADYMATGIEAGCPCLLRAENARLSAPVTRKELEAILGDARVTGDVTFQMAARQFADEIIAARKGAA